VVDIESQLSVFGAVVRPPLTVVEAYLSEVEDAGFGQCQLPYVLAQLEREIHQAERPVVAYFSGWIRAFDGHVLVVTGLGFGVDIKCRKRSSRCAALPH
jgi:hypothetical protein